MVQLGGLLNKTLLFSTLFLPILVISDSAFPKDCLIAKDRGHRCKNATEPKLRYFFDNETEQCLPFLYKGCGGSENGFPSMDACRMNCIPMDYGWCAMKGKAYQKEKGVDMICSGPSSDPCPEEYVCKHLAFFGVCCPKEKEEKFGESFHPQCSKGKLVKYNDGGMDMTFLGKTCDDEFCPENSKCIQEEIFAHCCK